MRYTAFSLLIVSLFVSAARAVNPAGVVQAGAMVDVSVVDLMGPGATTTMSLRVDEKGTIRVPLIRAVAVSEMTTDAAAQAIAEAYQQANLIQQAVVTVAIREAAGTVKPPTGPLAVGETLTVTLYGVATPTSTTTVHAQVDKNGVIVLPLAGSIRVVGLGEAEALAAIGKAYADKQIAASLPMTLLRTSTAKE